MKTEAYIYIYVYIAVISLILMRESIMNVRLFEDKKWLTASQTCMVCKEVISVLRNNLAILTQAILLYDFSSLHFIVAILEKRQNHFLNC